MPPKKDAEGAPGDGYNMTSSEGEFLRAILSNLEGGPPKIDWDGVLKVTKYENKASAQKQWSRVSKRMGIDFKGDAASSPKKASTPAKTTGSKRKIDEANGDSAANKKRRPTNSFKAKDDADEEDGNVKKERVSEDGLSD